MVRVSNLCFLLLLQFSLCCSLLHTPAFAAKQSYIIYLGAHSHGPNPTAADMDRAETSHHELLGSILGSCDMARESITTSYRRHINGFAAELEEEHARQLASHPDVVSIFLNKSKKMHTTRVWQFLDLEGDNNVVPSNSAWKIARFGEDVIIGGIDSGVWPESASFNDRDLGPVPSKWRGECQNDTNYGVECNRKLIGAKYYNKGAISASRKQNSSFITPPELETARDLIGHGTHILSTAGGSFVANVSVYGSGYGTAKGGSPRARVASYKVCFGYGGGNSYKLDEDDDDKDENDGEGPAPPADCTDEDIFNAIDDAINDGVDVLTVSLGAKNEVDLNSFGDSISIGSFHAMMKGIPTIASAGNEGPGPKTVKNSVPWILTVGASSIDREFASYVTLGNKEHFKGRGISSKAMPSQDSYPLIAASDARLANATESDAIECKPGTIDPKKVKGKIVICRGIDGGFEDSEASRAGAVGMILGRVDKNETLSDEDDTIYNLPVSKLNPKDIDSVFDYVEATQDPVASMTAKTEVGIEPSPVMGSYSSRGPSPLDPAILKPDVTAPGSNIIAAYIEKKEPTSGFPDDQSLPFVTMTGTSMSGPAVAGVVGLLKTLHPKWSPAAIKSAIMTTAFVKDANKKPILDFNGAEATPFAYGSGHVNPNRAVNPGLVYDLTIEDYVAYICDGRKQQDIVKIFKLDPQKYSCPQTFDVANFNYPSIAIPDLTGSVTVTRKLKNVGAPATYKAQVADIPGIEVNVEPNSLTFAEVGQEKTFKVTFTPEENVKPNNDYVFGELIWSDGTHDVRSPIALKQKQQQ